MSRDTGRHVKVRRASAPVPLHLWHGLPAGGTATATLWNGRVTMLAGQATADDPEDASPRSDLILSPFFGLIGLVGLLFSVRLSRIAWSPS